MTKALRQAIMRRSVLKSKFLKNKSDENHKAFKKQKNYTKRLAKKERVKYFANLDLNKYTDNIKFWNTVKPMFSGSTKYRLTKYKFDDRLKERMKSLPKATPKSEYTGAKRGRGRPKGSFKIERINGLPRNTKGVSY